MINSKNLISLEGNLVADPETPNDNIMTFRIAVNNGGYESGKLEAGFFTVKVFYNGMVPSHAEFVKRQVESGNFSKGSRLSVVGQLRQERWTTDDDNRRDKIIIVADSVDYAGPKKDEEGTDNPSSDTAVNTSLPDSF